MRKFPRINIRHRKGKHSTPGTAPGQINIATDALKPQVTAIIYNETFFEEKNINGIAEIISLLQSSPDKVCWFHIRGHNDKSFFEELGLYFKFHRLEMEDVFNSYQRPKAEEYPGHLYFTSRMLGLDSRNGLTNDQLNLFLADNYVMTIQEKYDDVFEPVRHRIRNSKGYLRQQKADYLAYALMDSVIDYYYPVLEKIGDKLDELEDELLATSSKESLNKILHIKRELIVFRRTIWPERDKINDVLRSSFKQISEPTKVYFRDAYDHCIQLLDIVESYKEVTSSLMDVYQSSVSNRLNQVMKVLTIISTIFIPLTFIVGVYGMNFSYIHPVTGKVMPYNMPELYMPNGYLIICALMLLMVALQLYFYYKKGWLRFRE